MIQARHLTILLHFTTKIIRLSEEGASCEVSRILGTAITRYSGGQHNLNILNKSYTFRCNHHDHSFNLNTSDHSFT